MSTSAKSSRSLRPIFDAADITGDGKPFDRLLKDGEILRVGGMTIEVMHTPGHTPACVSYRIGDDVFVGDTLFMPDYGTARAVFRAVMRVCSIALFGGYCPCRPIRACGSAMTTRRRAATNMPG